MKHLTDRAVFFAVNPETAGYTSTSRLYANPMNSLIEFSHVRARR